MNRAEVLVAMDDHEPIAWCVAVQCSGSRLALRAGYPGRSCVRDGARAAARRLATVGVRMSASRTRCPGSRAASTFLVRSAFRVQDNAAVAFWATFLAYRGSPPTVPGWQ